MFLILDIYWWEWYYFWYYVTDLKVLSLKKLDILKIKNSKSIARSFLKNSSIYLFDDCFSSLDSDTEEKLISNLNRSFKDETIIIVSHRLSCLKYSDRIIVLQDGKIIQEGNHSKLIDTEGYYKDLYYKQMKE